MNKKELKQKGFKHDEIHDEWYYDREDLDLPDSGEGKVHFSTTPEERRQFKPNNSYRCEFKKNRHRQGKIHYDAIRLIYDNRRKPILEIYIQGGAKIQIYQNKFSIWNFDTTKDANYVTNIIPFFDIISFYGHMKLDITLAELQKANK